MDKELLHYQMAVLSVAIVEAMEIAKSVCRMVEESSVSSQKEKSDARSVVSGIQGTIVFLEDFKGRVLDE